MKIKVITTYITLLTTILVLVTIIVLYFNNFGVRDLLLNIAYGVFGSALVSFLICLFEYFSAKRQYLEDFYLASLKYLNAVKQIVFFDVDDDALFLTKYTLKIKRNLTKKEVMEFYDEAIQSGIHLKDNNPDSILTNLNIKQKEFIISLKTTIQSYITYIQFDINDLSRIISQIKFLLPFNKFNKHMYNSLYSPMIDTLNVTNKKAFYFKDFMIGQPVDFMDIINGLIEINNLFFKKEQKNELFLVWAFFEDALYDSIEEYRCKIYRKKYIKIKHSCKFHSIPDE